MSDIAFDTGRLVAEELGMIESDASETLGMVGQVAHVTDGETESKAAEYLSQIKASLKNAESARTRLVKPLNDHVKMINNEFKRVMRPLEEAESKIVAGLTAYRNSEAIKKAQEQKKELEQQARVAVAQGDIQQLQQISKEHETVSAVAPKAVQTSIGQIRYRKVKLHEVEDLEKIPACYWMLDEAKIREDVKAGISIPGVRVWEEDRPIGVQN